MPQLIGLCGFAGSGKDEFADALEDMYDYVKVGWSDSLCLLAIVVNPRLYIGRLRWWKLDRIVGTYGWTKAKKFPSVRKFLQVLGTEGGRECIHPDVWILSLMPRVKAMLRQGYNVVVTNCRFENECQAVLALGGTVGRVMREGVGPVNSHSSDQGLAFKYASFLIRNADHKDWKMHLYDEAERVHESLLAGNTGATSPPPVDAEMATDRFNSIVDRAVSGGISLILNAAAPEYTDPGEYVNRHDCKSEISIVENGLVHTVLIDGEIAGSVHYEDGVVDVEMFLARAILDDRGVDDDD